MQNVANKVAVRTPWCRWKAGASQLRPRPRTTSVSETVGAGGENDEQYKHFWKMVKGNYIDDPNNDVLASNIETPFGTPELLLTKGEGKLVQLSKSKSPKKPPSISPPRTIFIYTPSTARKAKMADRSKSYKTESTFIMTRTIKTRQCQWQNTGTEKQHLARIASKWQWPRDRNAYGKHWSH